jgi:A/G-specific adenine glycosylase
MLQQTQVNRVIPVWHAFLREFPDPTSCARAPQGDVVTAWRGMGYNRRAVNLHRCAIAVERDHDGEVPDQLDALLALPGIGAYTARAVLAFAFECDVGVVDVNAARVHARLAGRTVAADELQRLADDLTPAGDAWRWNQAVLDLGATVCTRRAPACERCPLTDDCGWHRVGRATADPAAAAARQSRFEGSDRQGRGRLVDALRLTPIANDAASLAAAMGWPGDTERAVRVAMTVVNDGIADWAQSEGVVRLR